MGSRPPARIAALAIGGFIVFCALGVAGFLYSGFYSVAATEQHLRPTFEVLDIGLRRSVEYHARSIEVPDVEGSVAQTRGLACFKLHCAQCHGAPGIARADFAKGFLPVPSSLSQAAHDWLPRELFWITRHGIKMTGMPAWRYQLDDEAMWSIVAFLQILPGMSPQTYGRLAREVPASRCGSLADEQPVDALAMGNSARGRSAILQYACTACHQIPGIVGPASHTGPALTGMGQRAYIGGVLPNTYDNLVRWLREPKTVNPHTAMPDMGLSEVAARDIAAYLVQLK